MVPRAGEQLAEPEAEAAAAPLGERRGGGGRRGAGLLARCGGAPRAAAGEVADEHDDEGEDEEPRDPARVFREEPVVPFGLGLVEVRLVRAAGDLEVGRDAGDICAEADGEGVGRGGVGRDFGRGVEKHLAEGPADFDVVDFVDGLEGVEEGDRGAVLAAGFYLGNVLGGGRGEGFETDARDADAVVQDVDEPRGLEADFLGGLLVDFAPGFGLYAFLDGWPGLAAEGVDGFLVGFEIVGGVVFGGHLEDFVRGVVVLGDADEVVHVEVDGGRVLAVDETRGV